MILARALGDTVPYAVKVHGSALEYVVKVDFARFGPFAREGLAPARTILVGSLHTAQSLWTAMEGLELRSRTRLNWLLSAVVKLRTWCSGAAGR